MTLGCDEFNTQLDMKESRPSDDDQGMSWGGKKIPHLHSREQSKSKGGQAHNPPQKKPLCEGSWFCPSYPFIFLPVGTEKGRAKRKRNSSSIFLSIAFPFSPLFCFLPLGYFFSPFCCCKGTLKKAQRHSREKKESESKSDVWWRGYRSFAPRAGSKPGSWSIQGGVDSDGAVSNVRDDG